MRFIINSILILFLTFNISFSQSYDSTFVEEFNDNSQKWHIDSANNQNVNRNIKNGKYIFFHQRQLLHEISLIETKLDYTEDFMIETKMRQIAGFEMFDYGLAWAYHAHDDYNFFGINPAQQYSIYRFLEVKKKEKIAFPHSQSILNNNNWNVLKIERKKDNLNFYINDTKVFTSHVAHKHICSGMKIGFLINNYKKVEIDYLKLSGKFKKLKLIKNPNNGHVLENLGENINSKYHELGPVIAPDGNKLFYFRKNHPENIGGRNQTDDIWYSERAKDNTWSKAKNVGYPLNNRESNFVISASTDNNSLMITNKYHPDGSFKDIGISLTEKDSSGKWQVPQDVYINEYYNLNKYVSSSVSADKQYLISSIEGHDSNGNMDLYVSKKIDLHTYSKPLNLGKVVNTFSNEISPFLAADNKTLYFSSYGHLGYGSADVFVTRRLDDTWQHWSEPENLGSEVNTAGWEAYFTLPASGEYAYLVSDKASFGLSDIYRIKMNDEAKPLPTYLVKGKVFNKKTNLPLKAVVKIYDLKKDSIIGEIESDPKDGSYAMILQMGTKYGFGADKNGFYPINENLDVSQLPKYNEIEKNLFLVPIEIGQTIRINNIFFEYNKSTLNRDSHSDLMQLSKLLNKYPKMNIEIAGHTDGIGSDEYNYKLSQERVNVVKIQLMEIGISPNRITTKGYGKTKPIAPNTSEHGKAQNRRVEFVIKSL